MLGMQQCDLYLLSICIAMNMNKSDFFPRDLKFFLCEFCLYLYVCICVAFQCLMWHHVPK
jgi:hypothetical protein